MNKVKVRKPTAVVCDIYGCLTSIDFINDLNEYAGSNVEKYIKDQWNQYRVMKMLQEMREEARELSVQHDIPEILDASWPDPSAIQKSLAKNFRWRLENGMRSNIILLIREEILKRGYEEGTLKSHVFNDVPRVFERWQTDCHIKVYTISFESTDEQRLFFKSTHLGDLTRFLEFIDASDFGHQRVFECIWQCVNTDNPGNVLFLTDSPADARVLQELGIQAVVVIRPGSDEAFKEELTGLLTVTSLEQIEFEKSA